MWECGREVDALSVLRRLVLQMTSPALVLQYGIFWFRFCAVWRNEDASAIFIYTHIVVVDMEFIKIIPPLVDSLESEILAGSMVWFWTMHHSFFALDIGAKGAGALSTLLCSWQPSGMCVVLQYDTGRKKHSTLTQKSKRVQSRLTGLLEKTPKHRKQFKVPLQWKSVLSYLL